MSTTNPTPEYLAQSRVTEMLVGWSIPIPIMVLSTGLRVWAELHHHRRKLLFDDYLMIIATAGLLYDSIASVAQCLYMIIEAPKYSVGRHIEAMPPEHYEPYRLIGYVFTQLSQIALALTKLAVLALYYRVFPSQRMRRSVIYVVILVGAWMVAMEIVYFLFCRPFEKIWHRNMEGTCVDAAKADKAHIATNMILDVIIFLLPMPIITRLRVPTGKKIGMGFLFTVGFATCFISGTRLVLGELGLAPDTSCKYARLVVDFAC
ncbi:uncharacterized protein BDV14DRAFT_203216 [Aspergillus stella-maris]|uniref:uncharacterized protein n=1 Tax=Aspergillus stella-maris TaxID=1810926 RepID=UPI003CCDA62E